MGILRFTESVAVVSHTSTATEIVRGLGYWFFYGGDLRGPWNDGVLDFTRRTAVIFVSFAIPALAMLAAGFLRWKHRAFFIGLVLIGMVDRGRGVARTTTRTVLGSLFKAFATSSTAGFALRSTARAVPMLVLGLAVLLGIGISAWWRGDGDAGPRLDRGRRGRRWSGVMCVVERARALATAGTTASTSSATSTSRPTGSRRCARSTPRAATPACSACPAPTSPRTGGATRSTRSSRASWTGRTSRASSCRGAATRRPNLLIALDRRVQDRLLDPNAIAPIARLMGVGDVLLRLDLQTDQFSLVSARGLWEDFTKHGMPNGLGRADDLRHQDPRASCSAPTSATRPSRRTPEPEARRGVPGRRDPQKIIRAHPAAGAARGRRRRRGTGRRGRRRAARRTRASSCSSAQYDASTEGSCARTCPAGAVLLVTDTNRRQGMRWAGMRNNYGYTEQAGEQPLRDDLLDQRLEIYPGVTDRARTVVRAARAEVGAGHHLRHARVRLHARRPGPRTRSTATAGRRGRSRRASRRSARSASSPSSSTR